MKVEQQETAKTLSEHPTTSTVNFICATLNRPAPSVIAFNRPLSINITLHHQALYTMSGEYAFRKIDIDALDEDVLLPSDLYDPDPRSPQEVGSAATQKAGEARGLVSK